MNISAYIYFNSSFVKDGKASSQAPFTYFTGVDSLHPLWLMFLPYTG